MNETVTRYPLMWPRGWKRVPAASRQRAHFSTHKTQRSVENGVEIKRPHSKAVTVADAAERLEREIERLGGRDEVLSTNIRIRMNGTPDARVVDTISDPGAAVYFSFKGKPLCLACDKWDRVADNIAALAQHIDAMRRIDRYGVGSMEQAFAGYAALPPSSSDWQSVFGVNGSATMDEVDQRYKTLAREHHPDRGGDPGMMARLNQARDAARKELS